MIDELADSESSGPVLVFFRALLFFVVILIIFVVLVVIFIVLVAFVGQLLGAHTNRLILVFLIPVLAAFFVLDLLGPRCVFSLW